MHKLRKIHPIRRAVTLAVLLILIGFAPVLADDSSLCFDPATATAGELVIEANSGAVLSGETRRARRARVEVIVTGKNPFKYSYTYAANVEPLDSSGTIGSFLALLSPLGSVADLFSADDATKAEETMDKQEEKNDAAEASAGLPGVAPSGCLGVEAEILGRLRGDLRTLIGKSQGLRGDIQRKTTEANQVVNEQAVKDFKQVAALDHFDLASCRIAAQKSVEARDELSNFQLAELDRKVPLHKNTVAKIQGAIEYFKPRIAACEDQRQELMTIALGLSSQAAELAGAAEKLKKTKSGFDQLAKEIEAALARDPFFEKHSLNVGSRPAVATIKIGRKEKGKADAKTEIVEVKVRFGAPLFSLSAGLGLSDIREMKIERQAGKDGEIFAVTEESDPTPLGAVLLNANLAHGKKNDWSFALSLGVSIGDGDEASNFGYLIGPSVGLLDNSFYLTLGYHLRDVNVLGGGFTANHPVPADFEGIPLNKRSEEGVMLVLSYRIR